TGSMGGPPAACASGRICNGCGSCSDRWNRLWSERNALLRVARRRTLNEDEAQDAVSEALLRGWQAADLSDEHLGAWLTRVTINLCHDIARDRARADRRIAYAVRHDMADASPEQRVIDL